MLLSSKMRLSLAPRQLADRLRQLVNPRSFPKEPLTSRLAGQITKFLSDFYLYLRIYFASVNNDTRGLVVPAQHNCYRNEKVMPEIR